MAVYDRSMFRGSRPTPQAQGAGDAVAEKFVSEVGNRVVSDAQQGIASAKDYVQVMNAMRGDQQTMKERRSELGGIVGMKDANKTPESVVTLVQPVMQMREAQGSVDDGIGQMAQKAMDIPVEGKMAGGIMQPIQMQTGGAASLKRLYQENLPMMREIYGDQTADLKKQALGQLLLGGLAPAGLAIAQGTPVAEALMPIGPYSAQLAGDVSKAKRAQEAAERSGAFELAQAQQKAAADAAAKAREEKGFTPGTVIRRGGETVATVPFRPETDRVSVFKLDPTNPMGFTSIDILKDAPTPEGYSRSKPEVGGYSTLINRNTGKITQGTDLYFSQQPAGTFSEPLDDTLIDVFDAQGKKQKIPYAQYMANVSNFTLEDPKEKVTVYPLQDIEVGGRNIAAGTSVALSKSFVDSQPEGTFSTEPPKEITTKAVFDTNTQTSTFATESQIKASNGTLVPVPKAQGEKKPVFDKVLNEAVLKTDQEVSLGNRETERFVPIPDKQEDTYKTIYPNRDIELESGVTLKAGEGYMLPLETRTKIPVGSYSGKEPKQSTEDAVTVSRARRNLEDLSKQVLDGDRSRDTLMAFDTNLAALVNNRSFGFQMTGEGGGMINIPEQVPSYAINALKAIKEGAEGIPANPEFGDYGLLAVEEAVTEFPEVTIIKGTEDFSEANFGATGLVKRAIDKLFVPIQNLTLGRSQEGFPGALKAVKTISAINNYAEGVFISAVGRQNQNQIDAFRAILPNPAGVLESVSSQAGAAMRTSDRLSAQRIALERELGDLTSAPSNNKRRAKLRGKIEELRSLSKNFELLASMLRGKTGSGTTISDPAESDAYIFGPRIEDGPQ